MSRKIITKISHLSRAPDELIFEIEKRQWSRRLTSPYGAAPTPEPTVEIRPEWGELGSEEFSEKLEAWHKKYNG